MTVCHTHSLTPAFFSAIIYNCTLINPQVLEILCVLGISILRIFVHSLIIFKHI